MKTFTFDDGIKKIQNVICSVSIESSFEPVKIWAYSAIKYLCLIFNKDYFFYVDIIKYELDKKKQEFETHCKKEEVDKCQYLNT